MIKYLCPACKNILEMRSSTFEGDLKKTAYLCRICNEFFYDTKTLEIKAFPVPVKCIGVKMYTTRKEHDRLLIELSKKLGGKIHNRNPLIQKGA